MLKRDLLALLIISCVDHNKAMVLKSMQKLGTANKMLRLQYSNLRRRGHYLDRIHLEDFIEHFLSQQRCQHVTGCLGNTRILTQFIPKSSSDTNKVLQRRLNQWHNNINTFKEKWKVIKTMSEPPIEMKPPPRESHNIIQTHSNVLWDLQNSAKYSSHLG